MTEKAIVRSILALREMGLSDTQIIEFILRIEGEEVKNAGSKGWTRTEVLKSNG